MHKDDMISPVEFIRPGQCPVCKNPLIIHHFEATTLLINKDGRPLKILEEKNKVSSYCPICGYTGTMIRNGMNYTQFFKGLECDNILSDVGFKSVKDEKNPFAK